MKKDISTWEPKTSLGRRVKEGKFKNLEKVLASGSKILEPEIVDFLIPNLEEEVLDVNLVQKIHRSGRKARFRALAAVGNKNGYVGIGLGKSKEAGPAIRKAISVAKLNVIAIRRGCGSWECTCKDPHTVPYKSAGKCASTEVILQPAPRGVGLVAGDIIKSILKLAGVSDIWCQAKGQTSTTVNYAFGAYRALKKTNEIQIRDENITKLGIVSGESVG